jgi:hypothetical protein
VLMMYICENSSLLYNIGLTDLEHLKAGDIVKICDELVRRGDWPIERVESVYPGDDGVVRLVKLKTLNGYLKRPVAKLAVVVLNDGK